MKTARDFMEEQYPEAIKLFNQIGEEIDSDVTSAVVDMLEDYKRQNTLDREKVMEIFRTTADDRMLSDGDGGEVFCGALFPDQWDEAADAICSLFIPSVSEEEIRKLYFDNSYFDDYGDWYMNIEGFKAAIKELLNQKR